jgi:phosphatidate phosphatase APP1
MDGSVAAAAAEEEEEEEEAHTLATDADDGIPHTSVASCSL